jgi:hypothetical protein
VLYVRVFSYRGMVLCFKILFTLFLGCVIVFVMEVIHDKSF